jgi:hypothetical protein
MILWRKTRIRKILFDVQKQKINFSSFINFLLIFYLFIYFSFFSLYDFLFQQNQLNFYFKKNEFYLFEEIKVNNLHDNFIIRISLSKFHYDASLN